VFCDLEEGRPVEDLFQRGHGLYCGYKMYRVYKDLSKRMGACPRGFAGAGNIMGGFGEEEEEVRSECEGEF